jgi:hypothetical protein
MCDHSLFRAAALQKQGSENGRYALCFIQTNAKNAF